MAWFTLPPTLPYPTRLLEGEGEGEGEGPLKFYGRCYQYPFFLVRLQSLILPLMSLDDCYSFRLFGSFV